MATGLRLTQENSVGDVEMFTDDGVNVKIFAGADGTTGNLDLRASGVVTISGGDDFHVSGGDITLGGATPTLWLYSTQDGTNGAYLRQTSTGKVELLGINNQNIEITPRGTGKVVLSGLQYPSADGTNGQVLKTNGSGVLSWVDQSGGSGGGTDTVTVFRYAMMFGGM